MKNIETYTGKLQMVKRLNNTYYGNARLILDVDGKRFFTKRDCSTTFDAQNLLMDQVRVRIGEHYGKPTLDHIEKI